MSPVRPNAPSWSRPSLFGIVFIAMLLGLALLLLVLDPSEVQKTIDRPVLYPKDKKSQSSADETPDAPASGDPKS